MRNITAPELLAPAGDSDSLKAALLYGADAVYIGAKSFSMRSGAENFQAGELAGAAAACHARGAALYLACNTLPRGKEADELPQLIRLAAQAGIDAIIAADVGVMMLAKRLAPELNLHVSTQFGVVNWLTARELYELGASRVILSRELSLDEIADIRAKTPPELTIEAFVHGAMCVSVSGRCVLSNYMTGRDANRGACAQPCRWRYALMESERPGQYFPVKEEDGYSYILNANDLCMIGHLDKLRDAGIGSFKIEGRAKSPYYVAAVTGAYRRAIDILIQSPESYSLPDALYQEVEKISHRPYSTGFYLPGRPPGQDSANGGYLRQWELAATVDDYENGCLICTERNRFYKNETLEAIRPDGEPLAIAVKEMLDENDDSIDVARHPMMRVKIPCDIVLAPGSMLRRRKSENETL